MPKSKNSNMQEFINDIENISKYNIDILIQGETGVGKDFWAKYIYQKYSPLGKFIAINCAAIPENLAETELFGSEVGAYTGARKRIGKIELADNGCLYLDEIDSMPLNIQAKLLRALQEKGCERVGSSDFIHSNFRVIASTKSDLLDLIQKNLFRDDLYYRLNVINLKIPALRHRIEDILDLFKIYLNEYSNKLGISYNQEDLSSPALKHLLTKYSWHGNIRELISVVQRFLLKLPLNILDNKVFAENKDEAENPITDLKAKLKNIEKSIILSVLQKNNFSLSKSSSELGLPIPTLHYRIKLLNIKM
jgi:transcriptional regulator with PAS, ATPase and Fis domain